MMKFVIQPTKDGFRFSFESETDHWFSFDYIATCVGSRVVYGTQKGYYSNSVDWYVVIIDEVVMSIGVTCLLVSKNQKDLNSEVENNEKIYDQILENNIILKYRKNLYGSYPSDDEYDPYVAEENQYSPYLIEYNQYEQYLNGNDTYNPYLDQYNQ